MKILQEINKQGERLGRVIPCLLQIYIASEETKFGLDEKEAIEILKDEAFKSLKNITIMGVMGMATNTENTQLIHQEFSFLKQLSDKLKATYSSTQHPLQEISMGMSSDFEIAIEEGSTMIRVGSHIFGSR